MRHNLYPNIHSITIYLFTPFDKSNLYSFLQAMFVLAVLALQATAAPQRALIDNLRKTEKENKIFTTFSNTIADSEASVIPRILNETRESINLQRFDQGLLSLLDAIGGSNFKNTKSQRIEKNEIDSEGNNAHTTTIISENGPNEIITIERKIVEFPSKGSITLTEKQRSETKSNSDAEISRDLHSDFIIQTESRSAGEESSNLVSSKVTNSNTNNREVNKVTIDDNMLRQMVALVNAIKSSSASAAAVESFVNLSSHSTDRNTKTAEEISSSSSSTLRGNIDDVTLNAINEGISIFLAKALTTATENDQTSSSASQNQSNLGKSILTSEFISSSNNEQEVNSLTKNIKESELSTQKQSEANEGQIVVIENISFVDVAQILEAQGQANSQTEIEVQTELEALSELEGIAEIEAEIEFEAQTELEAQHEFEAQNEFVSRSEFVTQIELESQTELETQTELGAQIELGAQTELESQIELEAQTEFEGKIIETEINANEAVEIGVNIEEQSESKQNVKEVIEQINSANRGRSLNVDVAEQRQVQFISAPADDDGMKFTNYNVGSSGGNQERKWPVSKEYSASILQKQ